MSGKTAAAKPAGTVNRYTRITGGAARAGAGKPAAEDPAADTAQTNGEEEAAPAPAPAKSASAVGRGVVHKPQIQPRQARSTLGQQRSNKRNAPQDPVVAALSLLRESYQKMDKNQRPAIRGEYKQLLEDMEKAASVWSVQANALVGRRAPIFIVSTLAALFTADTLTEYKLDLGEAYQYDEEGKAVAIGPLHEQLTAVTQGFTTQETLRYLMLILAIHNKWGKQEAAGSKKQTRYVIPEDVQEFLEIKSSVSTALAKDTSKVGLASTTFNSIFINLIAETNEEDKIYQKNPENLEALRAEMAIVRDTYNKIKKDQKDKQPKKAK